MASNKSISTHDNITSVHPDLLATRDLVYSPANFTWTPALAETESAQYGAYAFEINGLNVRFRVAKITPKKVGQFVTLWKRSGNGPTQPYDASDAVDFFVICTRSDTNFGQFVFPKSVLLEKNIFSTNGTGGKRGIRVYPPWDKTTNKQAQKTQKWQLNYFLEIPSNSSINYTRANMLYSNN